MGLDEDLAAFEARLDAAIQSAMETEVTEAAKSTLQESVYTQVYDKYQPKMYLRAGDFGGLSDEQEMEAEYDPLARKLTVTDMRRDEDDGRLVAPVVESGRGYRYRLRPNPGPRPFHSVAEAEMGNGLFEAALAAGLRRAGML